MIDRFGHGVSFSVVARMHPASGRVVQRRKS